MNAVDFAAQVTDFDGVCVDMHISIILATVAG